MKHIFSRKKNLRYKEDLYHLEEVLLKNGYYVTDLYVLQDVWQTYSECLAAGWLSVKGMSEKDIIDSVELVLDEFIVIES